MKILQIRPHICHPSLNPLIKRKKGKSYLVQTRNGPTSYIDIAKKVLFLIQFGHKHIPAGILNSSQYPQPIIGSSVDIPHIFVNEILIQVDSFEGVNIVKWEVFKCS